MHCRLLILALIILCFNFCSSNRNNIKRNNIKNESLKIDSIIKLEMNLSAFGVESDDFPNIDAYIDFQNDSSFCKRSFYNPAYKGSNYSLNKDEIKKILKFLMDSDLEKLKKEYTVQSSDQPNSTTIIYTNQKKFVIKDYGLKGEYPLQKLYKIVYKL